MSTCPTQGRGHSWGQRMQRDSRCSFLCWPLWPLVFPLASGVASCLLCASYAFFAVCTFDSVTASGFAFPCFSCFVRPTCSVDKLGGVAAAAWVSV